MPQQLIDVVVYIWPDGTWTDDLHTVFEMIDPVDGGFAKSDDFEERTFTIPPELPIDVAVDAYLDACRIIDRGE